MIHSSLETVGRLGLCKGSGQRAKVKAKVGTAVSSWEWGGLTAWMGLRASLVHFCGVKCGRGMTLAKPQL